MNVDQEKLERFAEHAVSDLGGGYMGIMVSLGHKLGLYRAMAGAGPLRAEDVARRTGCEPRYVREWLNSQVAGEYLDYHGDGLFELNPEQAVVLADEDSPWFIPHAWNTPASMWFDEERSLDSFRRHTGVGWGEHHERLFCGVAAFFRNGYRANIVQHWLPGLTGVCDKLRAGAKVADVGCGCGYSTLFMAQAFPASEFHGFDVHEESLEEARRVVKEAGVDGRVRFERARAKDMRDADYDLVCFFDCLHDMGDPVGALRHVRTQLAEDGTVMLVEPFAGDRLEDNIGLVGKIYYAASTTLCCPHSRSEEVGLALGAQAGETRLREICREAGFAHFRRAAETPFNLVLEAKAGAA